MKPDVMGLCWAYACAFVLCILKNNRDCYQQFIPLHKVLIFLLLIVLPENKQKKKRDLKFPKLD